MQDKAYKPKDNILMTNIMMLARGDIQEIHVGGIFEFENINQLPQFWDFVERHLNEEFDVELYSYVLYGSSGITRAATDEEMRIVIDDEFPNNPIYAENLRGEDNNSNSMGYKMRASMETNNVQVVYTPKQSSATGGIIQKKPTEEELEQKETTEMITAEDLVEQAIYAANAPKCCSPKKQAENMLNMLGANIVDSGIYHTPDEHPSEANETSKEKKITINAFDKEWTLTPELVVYVVPDFMGDQQHNIGLNLYCEGENGLEPFATLTKSFGEFIGQKYCAYVDTNNCPFASQLLEQGIAVDTGFTKQSGFCSYPLWRFDEEFLKGVNERLFWLYSGEFDEYMESMCPSEESIDEQSQKM